MEGELKTFYCKSCGAKLVSHSLVNLKCSYCGSSIVIDEKFDINFDPDAIVVFKNDVKKVAEALKNYISTSDKMDLDRSQYIINSISPVYVPCTIYTFKVDTYRKASIHEGDDIHTYSEYRAVDKIVVCHDGSCNVPDVFITGICPFDLSNIQTFNPAYLSGAYSEASDDTSIKNNVLSRIKGLVSEPRIFKGIEEIRVDTLDELNAYLPVWFATVTSNGSKYTFVMNDTTDQWTNNVKIKEKKSFMFKHPIISTILFLLMGGIFYFVGIFLFFGLVFLFICAPVFLVIAIILGYVFSKNSSTEIGYERENEMKDINVIEHSVLVNRGVKNGDISPKKELKLYLDGKLINA